MPPRENLAYSLSRGEWETVFQELGQPTFRARQVWNWLYIRFAADWRDMTNLSASLREQLANRFTLDAVHPVAAEDGLTAAPSPPRDTVSAPGPARPAGRLATTRKLLLELNDGARVETVLIPARQDYTVCVSSQVGCKFGCAFCASGQSGFQRDLETGEMVGQAIAAQRAAGAPPSHLVFMGMGEPLDNIERALAAARIFNDSDGFRIGARRITLSTSGIIPGIERLAGEGLQFELSVSLHAPDTALRTRLMPVNRAYPLPDLLAACRRYAETTGRLITFEYTLIRGVNDSPAQARDLARLLRTLPCRVNLIPLSPVAEFEGVAPPPETAERFIRILAEARINATLRLSKGASINAACGQLRLAHRGTPRSHQRLAH